MQDQVDIETKSENPLCENCKMEIHAAEHEENDGLCHECWAEGYNH